MNNRRVKNIIEALAADESLFMYHKGVQMTQVASAAEVDEANEFYYNDCNLSKRSRVSQKPILSAFSKIVFRKYNFALQSLKGL